MEAKRRALDEIAARQRAADAKRRDKADQVRKDFEALEPAMLQKWIAPIQTVIGLRTAFCYVPRDLLR